MAWLALVFLGIFAFAAFGLRMAVQLARTGSSGFKGISGAPGRVEWSAGVLFAISIWIAGAGPVLQALDAIEPVSALDGPLGHALGVVLAVGGIAIVLVAQFAMGDAWRIGVDHSERTELVTDGPFTLVRNPIYAGMIPAFAGIALLAPNAIAIAGAALVFVALELQTRAVEEPYLREVHGDAYAAYAASVGRFVPGVGRLAPPAGGARQSPSR